MKNKFNTESRHTAERKSKYATLHRGGELGQYKIFISDEQFEDLCNRLSLDEMEKYFNIVADCEREGKRYKRKSHYQAIIEMATRDRALL